MQRPPERRSSLSRRGWLAGLLAGAAVAGGCLPASRSTGRLERVWGRRGTAKGQLQKPRAMAIDAQDRLYIVDMTARIQVFDRDGEFQRGWSTPESANGKPCGLSFDRQGHLMVADTHYFRVLFYDRVGVLQPERTIGGTCGSGPGEFNFVTDAVQDSRGNIYVAEYGQFDRVQKFNAQGEFLCQWGSHGSRPQQFIRPQGLAVDDRDWIWVADACNHRIQVFDASTPEVRLVQIWGQQGSEPGQLSYPYDLVLDEQGHVYVCEFGNHRVQKFTRDGQWLGSFGEGGSEAGQFSQPWALARDSRGRIHVLDTYNHRVQRIRL